MSILRRSHAIPTLKLLVIGPVDTEKSDALSPQRAKDFGVDDQCVFAGLRQDMPSLYAAMDVFVLPSHREGFPRAPMEAAAMELPVVATDIRGCREVVVDGVTGALVGRKNAVALAAAIAMLHSDKGKAHAFGQQGRVLAERKFDQRIVFAKVAATYERLYARRPR